MIPIDVEDRILSEFANGKHGEIKAILIELAEKENFNEAINYIMESSTYEKSWIKKDGYSLIFDKAGNEPIYYEKCAKSRIEKNIWNDPKKHE